MSDTVPNPLPAGDNSPPARDQYTGHNYDGIQEYDNPTPGWWVWIFAASVVFAVFYFVYYHSGVPDRSIYDRYQEAQDAAAKKKLAALGITDLVINEPNMLKWMATPDFIAYGRSVFKQNCTSCHGENGQGIIGPNLTDDYYKNIKVITDIPRVITSGANNGAMPSWRRLGNVDIGLVAAYVASLRGENLPSGISPATYGDRIPPWPPLPAPATAPAAATGQAPR